MDEIQQIDNVLKYLVNTTQNDFAETIEEISEKIGISLKDCEMILRKLERDFNVEYHFISKNGIETNEKTYYISFEGNLFYNNNGYKGYYKREWSKYVKDEILNFSLIFGGLGAGIYYSALLIRWACNMFC